MITVFELDNSPDSNTWEVFDEFDNLFVTDDFGRAMLFAYEAATHRKCDITVRTQAANQGE